jgi:osmotically-inducible protein OsmY
MYPDLRLCHRNEQKLESGLAAGAHIADEITATGAEDKKYSDAELTQAALAAISRDAPMAAGKVRSVVRNGWLILGGEVREPAHKRAAESAVRHLDGIRGLSNNILIESEAITRRVSQKIDEAFGLGARLSAHRVSVTARDHVVILSGFVRNSMEREEAQAAAWAVPGVAEVINRIRTA